MRSSLQDVRVYGGADCGSDHFLLITKMRLKFRMLKHAEKEMIFNTSKLRHTKKKLVYQLQVRNKFASLERTDDIEVRWPNFKDAVHTAADSIIGRRRGTRKEQWVLKIHGHQLMRRMATRQFLMTWHKHMEESTMILIKLWGIGVNVTKISGWWNQMPRGTTCICKKWWC